MNDVNTDLHMHSTASDGGYSPTELIKKCREVGLEYIALTDHDTVAGVGEAIDAGIQFGVKVIPGIELSTKVSGKSVHMLGYGIDWKDENLLAILKSHQEQRRKRLDVIIRKLRKVQIELMPEDVLEFVDGGSIGRPHVAKALIKKGYVKDVAEAFENYLAEGKPCYVPKEKEMTPEEAINLIHQTGGVAVIAHPVYYDLDDVIEELIQTSGLDGVEVYHRDHSPQEREHYLRLVKKWEKLNNRSLLVTGGSDFHHEEYGRKKEPLGVTRISNGYALELINLINK